MPKWFCDMSVFTLCASSIFRYITIGFMFAWAMELYILLLNWIASHQLSPIKGVCRACVYSIEEIVNQNDDERYSHTKQDRSQCAVGIVVVSGFWWQRLSQSWNNHHIDGWMYYDVTQILSEWVGWQLQLLLQYAACFHNTDKTTCVAFAVNTLAFAIVFVFVNEIEIWSHPIEI